MFVLIWLILIVAGFVVKKSKPLAIIQISYMIFLFGTVTWNADYENYIGIFYNYVYSGTMQAEWLLKFLSIVVNKIGGFQIFYFAVAAIGMFFIYKSILFYTDKISLCLSFYMISPFIIDGTQIRNFLGMAIWLYFTKYLYKAYLSKKNKSNDIFYYCIGVILASGMHTAFYCTFIFLLILFIDEKKMFIFSIVFAMFTFIWGFFNGSFQIINSIMNTFFKNDNAIIKKIYFKFMSYLATSIERDYINNIKTIIYISLYFIVVIFLYYIIKKHQDSLNHKSMKYELENKKLSFILSINSCIMILIPFFFVSAEFYRLQRNICVLNYTLLFSLSNGNIFKKGMKLNYINIITFAGSLILSFIYFWRDEIRGNYLSVFAPLFKLL